MPENIFKDLRMASGYNSQCLFFLYEVQRSSQASLASAHNKNLTFFFLVSC